MDQFLKYWPVILVLINGGVAWICWSLHQVSRNAVSQAKDEAALAIAAVRDDLEKDAGMIRTELRDVDTRLIKAEERLEDVADDVKNLPTKADLARVEGEVKATLVEARAAAAGIGRLESFLLERGMEAR